MAKNNKTLPLSNHWFVERRDLLGKIAVGSRGVGAFS
jgi:hypothetical protein